MWPWVCVHVFLNQHYWGLIYINKRHTFFNGPYNTVFFFFFCLVCIFCIYIWQPHERCCHHPRFADEDFGSGRLSDLPEFAQLLRGRQDVRAGALAPESLLLTNVVHGLVGHLCVQFQSLHFPLQPICYLATLTKSGCSIFCCLFVP